MIMPDSSKRADEHVESLAVLATPLTEPVKWFFEAAGRLLINDKPTPVVHVGAVYTTFAAIELGAGVKVRDWVFCTERLTPLGLESLASMPVALDKTAFNNEWYYSAFRDNKHYVFDAMEPQPTSTANGALLLSAHVVEAFLLVLHEELLVDYMASTPCLDDGTGSTELRLRTTYKARAAGSEPVTCGTPGWVPTFVDPDEPPDAVPPLVPAQGKSETGARTRRRKHGKRR